MRLKSLIKTSVLGEPGERVRSLRGGLLRGFQFPIDTRHQSMLMMGLAETEIHRVMRMFTARATYACDIGANAGYYTLYFASRPNISQVFAFDPQERFADIIRANLRRNDPAFLEKTTIITKFVGDRGEDGWCRLDEVLADCPGPIVFKIDVDGGEVDVLKSARRTLQEKPCELIVETHSHALERGCLAYLQELGYATRIIKNGWYRLFLREHRDVELNRWLSATKR